MYTNAALAPTIIEKLQAEKAAIAALISGPFKLSELTAVLENTAAVLAEVDGITKAKASELLLEVWAYFDETYKIVEYLDNLVALPVYLEPFDAMAFRYAIEKGLPLLVGLLPIAE